MHRCDVVTSQHLTVSTQYTKGTYNEIVEERRRHDVRNIMTLTEKDE